METEEPDVEEEHGPYGCDCATCRAYWIDVYADAQYERSRGY